MGLTYVVVAALIIAAASYAYMMSQDPEGSDMQPNALDSFRATKAQEGTVVPLTFGTQRLTGNLLWWGSLQTTENTQEVGGKDSGGDTITTGYAYHMDIWQALCIGGDSANISLLKIYWQDRERELTDSSFGTYILYKGDTITYPLIGEPYASPINPVCHIYFSGMFLGNNVSMVPTLHFVIKRNSSCPLTNANLSTGVNPAAIIWDLLIDAGAEVADIDTASFQTAATYWAGKNYGMNITFNKQEEVRNMINTVFNYVDGTLQIDSQNKFKLKAFRDTDTSSATMDTEDFKKFEFHRRSWEDVYTDFRANYIDQDQEYTTRTIRIRNTAVHALIGYERQKTVDLTAFKDVDTASKRLTEIMKRLSYPEAQITVTVSLEFLNLDIGDIVTINNTDYSISSAEFRIIDKDEGEIDKNEVKFTMIQFLETLFDDSYGAAGDADWTSPDYDPQTLAYQRVFELPYNAIYGRSTAYLVLGARKGVETNMSALVSNTGSDYVAHSDLTTFAQRGTLDEAYPDTTDTIDDTTGILFTPYRDDPEFSTLSRQGLFGSSRVVIINDEMMGFQTVTPEGGSSYRLTGVIRGLLNTTKATHASGNTIWLADINNNVLINPPSNDFYVKLLPSFGQNQIDAGDATAIHVTEAYKAKTPWPPYRIEVNKTGSSNVVEVFPTTEVFPGAGTEDIYSDTDQWPPEFDGDFQWYTDYDATVNDEADQDFTVTRAGAFVLYVRSRYNGRTSAYQSVSIGASDGEYIGPVV